MDFLMIFLDNSLELALANMDLNASVVQQVTSNDDDPLEGSSFTPTDVDIALDIEQEAERGEHNGSGSGGGDDFNYERLMQEDQL